MYLNTTTPMHDDMYNVNYQWSDNLDKLVLFEPIRQIRVSHAILQVTSFVYLGPDSKSFHSLEDYIYQLRGQLADVATNPRHKFMEDDLLKVID